MKTKRCDAGTVSVVPALASSSTSRSSRPSPSAAVTVVHSRTPMLPIVRSWSMRYCDIDASRLLPRTSNVTDRATREKNTAACPAEFAPPTM